MRRIEVRPRASGWVVRVESEDGGTFHHECATERQARYFAAIYRLQRACLKMERRHAPSPRGRDRRARRAEDARLTAALGEGDHAQ